MLVPCVEGESGIFPVVAEVAWDVQSCEVAETLPSVPSLLRCLSFSSSLPVAGVGGSIMIGWMTAGSVAREGLMAMPFAFASLVG